FVDAAQRAVELPAGVKNLYEAEMSHFFELLQRHHAEYGYRTAYEAGRFICFYGELGGFVEGDISWFPEAMDCVIVQKLLPKLHGSRAKVSKLLKDLWRACLFGPNDRDGESKNADPSEDLVDAAHYKLSADKIGRMWRLLAE